jgi:hypothetical protein
MGVEMKFYVYAHSNDEHGVFYVGKGQKKRLYTTTNRSLFWKRIVKKHGYTASILYETDDEDDAFKNEIAFIAKYKNLGQCIANMTLGGDGVRVEKRWWYEKVSKALTGMKRPKGSDSPSYKNFIDKDVLIDLYERQKMPALKIAKLFGVSVTTVITRLNQYGINIRTIYERGTPIQCSNGKSYKSITEAAKDLKVHRENIRKVLQGKYKTTGGFTFYKKETQ